MGKGSATLPIKVPLPRKILEPAIPDSIETRSETCGPRCEAEGPLVDCHYCVCDEMQNIKKKEKKKQETKQDSLPATTVPQSTVTKDIVKLYFSPFYYMDIMDNKGF